MDIAGSSRVHPTALKRRCRQGDPSNTPPIEEGEGNVSNEEPIEKKVMTEPFLSGPTDITLLSSFKTHIAINIWIGDVSLRHEFLFITCRNISFD